jgi:hypothetical protein
MNNIGKPRPDTIQVKAKIKENHRLRDWELTSERTSATQSESVSVLRVIGMPKNVLAMML